MIAQVLDHGIVTLIAGLVVAMLLYSVLDKTAPGPVVDGWIIAMTIITLARLTGTIVSKITFSQAHAPVIERFYLVGALLGGICWGAIIFAYDPSMPVLAQLYILITLVGMASGSLASNAIYLPIFIAFSAPILLSLIGWSLFLAEDIQYQFAMMAIVYTALITYVARQYSRNIRNSVESDEEKQILIREIKSANLHLQKLAYEDPLTKLSNRRQFEVNADQIFGQLHMISTSILLMVIDIDNFKEVNDTFGHAAGDKLLQAISSRIQAASRRSELVAQSQIEAARIGGDEFIIIYHLDTPNEGAVDIAQRVLRHTQQTLTLNDTIYSPSISIGIALAPEHATSIDELMLIADRAMYRAKSAGGGRVEIANDEDCVASEATLPRVE